MARARSAKSPAVSHWSSGAAEPGGESGGPTVVGVAAVGLGKDVRVVSDEAVAVAEGSAPDMVAELEGPGCPPGDPHPVAYRMVATDAQRHT